VNNIVMLIVLPN